ncbi:MAG: aminodeoxychorismate synthase component I [Campylobacterales bacterium]|nr:aminodeoxychorismate synthase component I [Campylobacterales bacterium]
MNHYGSLREPFLFIINYDQTQSYISKLDQLDTDIHYSIIEDQQTLSHALQLDFTAINIKEYKVRFDQIQTHIRNGNTYLINLTSPSVINTKIDLYEAYTKAKAKYKIYFKDQFISFSPEQFVQINQNQIATFPMKGTIDANIKNASKTILEDPKEIAEHTMVVDLLRNDLGQVARNIKVEDFRYIDKIKAGSKELLQVSSKITGNLDENWHENIGTIFKKLLPAGSITGAPKKSTVDILKETEGYDRGYFTGIWGIYDGTNLQSAVMIRFIEKLPNNTLVYKSGGGITCDSDYLKEYQEMCNKVYIP